MKNAAKYIDELRLYSKRLLIISRYAKKKKRVNIVRNRVVGESEIKSSSAVLVNDNYEYKNEKRRRWLFEYVERIF